MKILSITILSLLIAACGQPMKVYDSRLEGTWVSDRVMTLQNLDQSDVSEEMLVFLEENLGDLTFIFENSTTAVVFQKSPDILPEFKEYELVSSRESSVVIVPPDGEEVRLTFEGRCYYVLAKAGYKEYFCKEE